MIALLITIALATVVVETAFVFVSVAKRVLNEYDVPSELRYVAYFWLVVGYPADVAFNWLRGTIMFREMPRELLFTDRVQRLVADTGWRGEKARRWALLMNAIDPGHV